MSIFTEISYTNEKFTNECICDTYMSSINAIIDNNKTNKQIILNILHFLNKICKISNEYNCI